MANPAKVLAFLDLTGHWDPSLGFVMAGAIAVGGVAIAISARRTRSLLGIEMKLPPTRGIDLRLIGGSVLFGAGWGMAGFCPGPALVALGMGLPKALAFVVAMLAGMLVFEFVQGREQLRGSMQAEHSSTDA